MQKSQGNCAGDTHRDMDRVGARPRPGGNWQIVLVAGGRWETVVEHHRSAEHIIIVAPGIADTEERRRASEAGVITTLDWSDGLEELLRSLDVNAQLKPATVAVEPLECRPGPHLHLSDSRLDLVRALPTTLLEIALRRSYGATGGEIARDTHRSEKTVKTHFQRLNRRLGLTSVRDLQEWRPQLELAWSERKGHVL